MTNPQTLVWKKTTHYSTDNDNADDRSVNALAAWKSGKYLIIRQKSENGLFILKTPDGEGQWGLPYLYQAQEAAQCHANGVKYVYSERSALADAAATTTPAEQAGDVGQAWRVKPLVWSGDPRWPSTSWASGYQINEQDADAWLMTTPNGDSVMAETLELAQAAAQADYTARVTAALELDPTPALGWRAMQTAAAEAVSKEAHGETVLGGQRFKTVKLEDAVDAILALPGPTDAQLLAEAMKLPEVRELVKAVKRLNDACDAMWNDHKRLEKNSVSFGQPYQIKELHIKAISEAQQALPDVLAKIGGAA